MHMHGALRHRACAPASVRAFSSISCSARQSTPRIAATAGRSPASSTNDAYHRQRRAEWIIVGVAGSAAAFGTWYYWNRRESRQMNETRSKFSLSSSTPTSFTIPVRSKQTGQPHFRVITPLTEEQVNARLRENENSTLVDRPAGACLVARYDTNSVASNASNEDRHAEVIVERDRGINDPPQHGLRETTDAQTAAPVRGDLCFFTVMDGHGGDFTSQVLSRKLVAFVALELDKVFKETGEYAHMARSKVSTMSTLWNSLLGSNHHHVAALDGDPDIVKRALIKGFRGLDKEITNTPLELLKQYELSLASVSKHHNTSDDAHSLSSLAHSIWPSSLGQPKNTSFSTMSQGSAYESILPAISGSCALMVYVDSARRDLYVASTGDSRAVAGYWDERAGRWEVEALSVDQTGRNLAEVRRIQREHPPDEAAFVIQRGRVLGGLEPTRAFGDARYKWDRQTQKRIAEAFLPEKYRRMTPAALKTPPYVTAEPLVQWRRIAPFQDALTPAYASASKSGASLSPAATTPMSASSSRELRFIIMATDGLWDLMSNEEAVGLVAGHLAGMRGSVRADKLQRLCFQPQSKSNTAAMPASSSNETLEQVQHGPSHPLLKSPNHQQTFTFEDDNLSTHLVRNALGGAARERVAGLLAIPSPESRRFRDDITVNVILFHAATTSTPNERSTEKETTTPTSPTSLPPSPSPMTAKL